MLQLILHLGGRVGLHQEHGGVRKGLPLPGVAVHYVVENMVRYELQ